MSLTIGLSPAEVIPEVLVRGVEDRARVERWGILHHLCAKVPRPEVHKRGGKQADNVGGQLAGG